MTLLISYRLCTSLSDALFRVLQNFKAYSRMIYTDMVAIAYVRRFKALQQVQLHITCMERQYLNAYYIKKSIPSW